MFHIEFLLQFNWNLIVSPYTFDHPPTRVTSIFPSHTVVATSRCQPFPHIPAKGRLSSNQSPLACAGVHNRYRSCCREADAVVEDNISHCQSQTMTVCERAEIYIHFPPIPQTCFFFIPRSSAQKYGSSFGHTFALHTANRATNVGQTLANPNKQCFGRKWVVDSLQFFFLTFFQTDRY